MEKGDIALIAHKDLDELAAQDLVEKGVQAVINTHNTFSGDYPARGAKYLLNKGVFLLDKVGEEIFSRVTEGSIITIAGKNIFLNGEKLAEGRVLENTLLKKYFSLAEKNIKQQLDLFVQNTLEYARKEKI